MIDTKALIAMFVQALTDDDFDPFAERFAASMAEIEALQSRPPSLPDTVTLLDDFAMSSLTGLINCSSERAKRGSGDTAEVIAERAYLLARAMVAERKRIVTPPSVVLHAIEFPSVTPPESITPSEFPTVESVLENLKKESGS
jgi:hypothetical protein